MSTRQQSAGRWAARWCRAAGACVGAGLLALTAARAEGPAGVAVDEAKAAALKAAYLRYLAEFAVWPESALAAPEAPIVIGIVGTDPHGVGDAMDKAIRDGSLPRIQEHTVLLRRYPALPERPDKPSAPGEVARPAFAEWVKGCHLVFVTRSEQTRWAAGRRVRTEQPVLTVSEIPGFAEAGGMVELALSPSSGRIGLRINLPAVEAAGLRLSSRLLGLKQGVELLGLPPAGERARPEGGGER
jgi:hypothetical protein